MAQLAGEVCRFCAGTRRGGDATPLHFGPLQLGYYSGPVLQANRVVEKKLISGGAFEIKHDTRIQQKRTPNFTTAQRTVPVLVLFARCIRWILGHLTYRRLLYRVQS
jgi:hypothetical protein